ncbi:MAG TPA: hypothetical protein P5110_09645 [Candidatus Omnitrophota bacterium]|nr:hypothetical protein [Candidatus Omnitrophota bacterium]
MNNQGCVATPTKVTAITKSFENLIQVIDECTLSVQTLEGRINPILKLMPTAPGDTAKRPSTDVQMADALNDLSDRIARIRNHVQDLIQRVEL